MATTLNVFTLEAKKADLEVLLAKAGEYVDDGYGDSVWEPMQAFEQKELKKQINKIENDLCKLYKQPAYLIAKTNFYNIIVAYIKNISPEVKHNI